MYRLYNSRTIHDNELDQMFADARQDGLHRSRFIIAEVESDDEVEIDGAIGRELEIRAYESEDGHCHSICGEDVLRAAEACGLVIGTVFESPGHQDKVVVLDDDTVTDAVAWAVMDTLPDWIVSRFVKLTARQTDTSRS